MTPMTPRERLRLALRHREPDRVPYDLASTQVTGISRVACANLRAYLGMAPHEPELMDVMQQVCLPGEDLLERLRVDTRPIVPLVSTNWNVEPRDEGEYLVIEDEWHCGHRMPKDGGHYYSLFASPLDDTVLTADAIDGLDWPDPADPRRWAGLREKAENLRARGYPVVMRGLCAGILEMACRVRPMDRFMMDLAMDEAAATRLLGKIADLKAAFWEAALDDLGGRTYRPRTSWPCGRRCRSSAPAADCVHAGARGAGAGQVASAPKRKRHVLMFATFRRCAALRASRAARSSS